MCVFLGIQEPVRTKTTAQVLFLAARGSWLWMPSAGGLEYACKSSIGSFSPSTSLDFTYSKETVKSLSLPGGHP